MVQPTTDIDRVTTGTMQVRCLLGHVHNSPTVIINNHAIVDRHITNLVDKIKNLCRIMISENTMGRNINTDKDFQNTMGRNIETIKAKTRHNHHQI